MHLKVTPKVFTIQRNTPDLGLELTTDEVHDLQKVLAHSATDLPRSMQALLDQLSQFTNIYPTEKVLTSPDQEK